MDDIDALDALGMRPKPTAQRPLLGTTVLIVEDSRFASEALRLLCLRSGARIRRADCLTAAERHLSIYRPTVAIVDLGLPDGSGLDLIAQLDTARPRVPVLLGMSGADRSWAEDAAREAGADGFLAKPLAALAMFQAQILEHLPGDLRPKRPRPADLGVVEPDTLALSEDLTHALSLLDGDSPPVDYLRKFLLGVARAADDDALETCVNALTQRAAPEHVQKLRTVLTDRISTSRAAL